MPIAQTAIDGGWPNLILQAGSFGLLAILVVWLGPNLFKELRAEREARDVRFENIVSMLQHKFEERNNALIAMIENQHDSWIDEMRRHTETLKEVSSRICRMPPNGNGGR
jgi:hypothetical protein